MVELVLVPIPVPVQKISLAGHARHVCILPYISFWVDCNLNCRKYSSFFASDLMKHSKQSVSGHQFNC